MLHAAEAFSVELFHFDSPGKLHESRNLVCLFFSFFFCCYIASKSTGLIRYQACKNHVACPTELVVLQDYKEHLDLLHQCNHIGRQDTQAEQPGTISLGSTQPGALFEPPRRLTQMGGSPRHSLKGVYEWSALNQEQGER